MRDPALAAVLSAIVPGVGQFYNGRILAGVLWLVLTPGLWIGTGGAARLDRARPLGLHRLRLRPRPPGPLTPRQAPTQKRSFIRHCE